MCKPLELGPLRALNRMARLAAGETLAWGVLSTSTRPPLCSDEPSPRVRQNDINPDGDSVSDLGSSA